MSKEIKMKLDDVLTERIASYSKIEGVTQEEFINNLLAGAMEHYFLKRSGGAVITLPNPQNYVIDTDNAKITLDKLMRCANENVGSNMPVPIFSIVAFLEQRLFYELEEDKKKFKDNMEFDNCAHCGESTKNTKCVREDGE